MLDFKKLYIFVIVIASSMGTVALFQNCGKSRAMSFEESSVGETTNGIDVVNDLTLSENETITLTVPEDQISDNGDVAELNPSVVWTFIDEDGVTTQLDERDLSLTLVNVTADNSGTYQATVTVNGSVVLVYVFIINIVQTVVEPGNINGLYEGYFVNSDDSRVIFVSTNSFSENEALSNCRLNAENNPHRGVICTYDGREIFNQDAEVVVPTVAVYTSYILQNSGREIISTSLSVTRVEATQLCVTDVNNTPGKSILCEWNGISFFSKIVDEPIACTQEYIPVCGVDNQTYGNACTAQAAGVDVKHSGQCEPTVETGLYRGFFIVDGANVQFIRTPGSTRSDALSNCELNANNNPNKSVMCTWKGNEIFRRTVAPQTQIVQVLSMTETPAAACARINLKPAGCFSGERRLADSSAIQYIHGTWGGANGEGNLSVRVNGNHYCYKTGQKQDSDATDLTVAYRCTANGGLSERVVVAPIDDPNLGP